VKEAYYINYSRKPTTHIGIKDFMCYLETLENKYVTELSSFSLLIQKHVKTILPFTSMVNVPFKRPME